jgi:phage shock protein PspC (stress-responsive transcriptional regulator)
LTFVAFVFIPLSFASSFFGMNIKQLDSGTVSIGYFFLLAILSGLLAYIISAFIKPAEEAMSRARERFAERESCDDSESMITPRRNLWGWMRRKVGMLQTIHEAWGKAESGAMEAEDYERESIPWHEILSRIVSQTVSKLWTRRSRRAQQNQAGGHVENEVGLSRE